MDLSKVVEEECLKLDVEFKAQWLTDDEAGTKRESREIVFPSELGFSMPVDLSLSKKAFECVMSGMSKGVTSFDALIIPRPHQPSVNYSPMEVEEMDLSFLLDSSKA